MFTLNELDRLNWALDGNGGADDMLQIRPIIEAKISNAEEERCVLSLELLQAFNSQFLSLCLCLLRHAKKHKVELIFTNTPSKLLDMARVGGVEFIFSSAL